MSDHEIVSREEWVVAREGLLTREKEHTRRSDELARQRRELPWVRVEKEYGFETDEGTRTLAELFDGRSQLLVYHFMFGPSYKAGCPTCSSMADTVDGALPHLHARDVTMLYVSQAPLEKLQAYKRRMGWNMPWVSSAVSDFNFDQGYSRTEEQTREAFAPIFERLRFVTSLPQSTEYERFRSPVDLWDCDLHGNLDGVESDEACGPVFDRLSLQAHGRSERTVYGCQESNCRLAVIRCRTTDKAEAGQREHL